MTLSTYEPPRLEIHLTRVFGLSLLSPYYRRFARSLALRGDERVLDFGAGSGVCSRYIAAQLRRGGQLDCVDVSRGWLDVARRTLRRYANVRFYHGHIFTLDLPVAAYDAVVVHFVLHDIPARERPLVLHALTARLKPGARLLLREPAGHGLDAAEIERLAAAAGLHSSGVRLRRSAIGAVYDACFTPIQKGNTR